MSDASPKKGGSVTVIIALLANLLVAIAKTIASAITGSASMVAEAAHSWADFGNEIFLLIADRRSVRESDGSHPLGYGREAYVWSMFAAFGIFTAGAVVSIVHGYQQLFAVEKETNYLINYIVLAVAVVLEGSSFLQAFRQARAGGRSRGKTTAEFALTSSNATLRAVFAEDAAALVGLAVAFLGILLHQLTGLAIFDAIGSILIGLLLGVVALVLIDRNRRFLVGQIPDAELRDRLLAGLLESPKIDKVTYLHLEFVGPGKLFVVAAVDFTGNEVETKLAILLRDIEGSIEELEHVERAVVTLSTPGDAALVPSGSQA